MLEYCSINEDFDLIGINPSISSQAHKDLRRATEPLSGQVQRRIQLPVMASAKQFALKDLPDNNQVISAVKFCPYSPSKLLVSSWDKNLYVFDIHAEDGGKLLHQIEHRAVIFDACWGSNEDEVFTCGTDNDVRRVNLTTNSQEVLSTHADIAMRVYFDPATSTLFSITFRHELHVHNIPPGMAPVGMAAKLQLPGAPLCMGATTTKLIIPMSERLTYIYDIPTLSQASAQSPKAAPNTIEVQPFQRRDASLKFMTICVAGMPDDKGYATSSIEGRVAVDWLDESDEAQARKYAFKCHRETRHDTDENGQPRDVDVVYPVHALAFNQHNVFATGGQDTTVALWDAVQKRRIRQYAKFGNNVKVAAFDPEGQTLAVGVCPGLEKKTGQPGADFASKGVTKVVIREVPVAEATGKAGKK